MNNESKIITVKVTVVLIGLMSICEARSEVSSQMADYRHIDLSKVVNVSQAGKGIFTTEKSELEQFPLNDARKSAAQVLDMKSIQRVFVRDGISFEVKGRHTGLIVLQGGREGNLAAKYPQKVSIPVGISGVEIYFLGQVGYLGYPETEKGKEVAKYVIKYKDGVEEEIKLINGVNFAGFGGIHYLPQATLAQVLNEGRGKVRKLFYYRHNLKRGKEVKCVEFIDSGTEIAPLLAAVTIRVKEGLNVMRGLKPLAEPDKIDLGLSAVSLNGKWKYQVDTGHEGEEKGYYKVPFDDHNWNRMNIPSNWYIEGLNYHGVVWYRHPFTVPEDWKNKFVRIWFGGVDYFADVWVNGTYLGRHEGYSAPFSYALSKKVKLGTDNLLVVRVDSPLETCQWQRKTLVKGLLGEWDARPPNQEGNTGGIWRSVYLVATKDVTLENVFVVPEFDNDYNSAKVEFRVELRNHSPKRLSSEIHIETKGKNFVSQPITSAKKVTISPGVSQHRLEIDVENPKLWWTWDHGKQNLYLANIRVRTGSTISDKKDFTFGLRDIKRDEKLGFYLNGKRFFIRGSNYLSAQWLSTMNRADYERDIQMMKEANLNALLMCVYVDAPEFYRVCDEKGIFLWQDMPFQWGFSLSEEFRRRAVNVVREAIVLLRNHPSICVWCCMNECNLSSTETGNAIYSAIEDQDPTRPVILNSGEWDTHHYPDWGTGTYVSCEGEKAILPSETGGACTLVGWQSARKILPEDKIFPVTRENYFSGDFHAAGRGGAVNQGSGTLYKSFQDYAASSQGWGARDVKCAVEHFRRNKYNPTIGYFQFHFDHCWPMIKTWSIVDYYRKPKPAYFALQETSQPVLACVDVYGDRWAQAKPGHEERYYGGDKFGGDVWVINDLYQAYPGSKLTWQLRDPEAKLLKQDSLSLDIKPNSVRKIGVIEWEIPYEVKTGRCRLNVELTEATGSVLSTNSYAFWVKNPSVNIDRAMLLRKGGLFFLDLSYYGDTPYHHNPFSVKEDLAIYPRLKFETVKYGGIPFNVYPEYDKEVEGESSVITKDCLIPIDNIIASKVVLLVGGGNWPFEEGKRQIGNIELLYADGTKQEKELRSWEDVWDYISDPETVHKSKRVWGYVTGVAIDAEDVPLTGIRKSGNIAIFAVAIEGESSYAQDKNKGPEIKETTEVDKVYEPGRYKSFNEEIFDSLEETKKIVYESDFEGGSMWGEVEAGKGKPKAGKNGNTLFSLDACQGYSRLMKRGLSSEAFTLSSQVRVLEGRSYVNVLVSLARRGKGYLVRVGGHVSPMKWYRLKVVTSKGIMQLFLDDELIVERKEDKYSEVKAVGIEARGNGLDIDDIKLETENYHKQVRLEM